MLVFGGKCAHGPIGTHPRQTKRGQATFFGISLLISFSAICGAAEGSLAGAHAKRYQTCPGQNASAKFHLPCWVGWKKVKGTHFQEHGRICMGQTSRFAKRTAWKNFFASNDEGFRTTWSYIVFFPLLLEDATLAGQFTAIGCSSIIKTTQGRFCYLLQFLIQLLLYMEYIVVLWNPPIAVYICMVLLLRLDISPTRP